MWIGVSRDVLLACSFFGLFDELAFVEGGAGADEGHEVWSVHCAPASLRGLDELERRRDTTPSGNACLPVVTSHSRTSHSRTRQPANSGDSSAHQLRNPGLSGALDQASIVELRSEQSGRRPGCLHQPRHSSAGTMSASTSVDLSRSTLPPIT